jgi:predicted Co/Zn/Cd cation transporter (cation efflux family)
MDPIVIGTIVTYALVASLLIIQEGRRKISPEFARISLHVWTTVTFGACVVIDVATDAPWYVTGLHSALFVVGIVLTLRVIRAMSLTGSDEDTSTPEL